MNRFSQSSAVNEYKPEPLKELKIINTLNISILWLVKDFTKYKISPILIIKLKGVDYGAVL